jgi:acyl-CoA thioesterase-1
MFTRHRRLLPNALLCAGFLVAAGPAQARPVRILPLGDSITQGGRADREEYTYRLPLARMLTDAGVAFDFVGSMSNGLSPKATWPDYKGTPFDRDHEGHYGWKTAQVRDHLAEWMPKWAGAPDIVLIHLGTNDQKPEDYDAAIVQPLKAIIGMLRKQNPQVVVLVGHLNFNDGAGPRIRPFVEAMATELTAPDSPVVTVHHYKGWHERPGDPESDTFDWAHPNPQGQRKMAQQWFDAMQPYLKTGR